MHTLITFLGKSASDRTTGYRQATYRFADGRQEQTPYFSLALIKHLRPDRVIVFGTASSMWDVFVEHLSSSGSHEALRLELMDAVAAGVVDEGLLTRVAPLLEEAVRVAVQPHLIGMAQDAAGQNEILDLIAAYAGNGAVSFDLTHGFRHLGMLGFLAGFMLERLSRDIAIKGLWYGALDMTVAGVTPVLRLDGLQDIQRWVDALNRFDANNDYGVFADLLKKDGMRSDVADCLREAAFRESVLHVDGARKKLQTVLKELKKTPLAGASGLFQERLIRHIEWARQERLSINQFDLAARAMRRCDYQRATLLGLEGYITRRCEREQGDPLSFAVRERVRSGLQDAARYNRENAGGSDPFLDLNSLRNAMAHGTPPAGRFSLPGGQRCDGTQLIQNKDLLRRVLQSCLDRLKDG